MSRRESQFDAVVFDMDGLMFNTEHLFFRIADEFMMDHGKRFTEEMMAGMIGRRAAEAGKVFHTMGGMTNRPIPEIMKEIKTRFYARMLTDSDVMPGLLDLLDILNKKGIPKSVATSSSKYHAETLIGHHGLMHQFQFVITSEDVLQGKPDPEIYLKSAHKLDLLPSKILVLEDSVAGLHAAKSAGAFAVGVPHQFSPGKNMSHADLIVESLADPQLIQYFT